MPFIDAGAMSETIECTPAISTSMPPATGFKALSVEVIADPFGHYRLNSTASNNRVIGYIATY